ncbi:MAG: hypothetical protein Q7U75_00650, partial [Desulfobacterales bacterium]|nr:hypothetical protein [Desulfobacterales bacterium]
MTARLLTELRCGNERELWEKLGVDRMARVSAKHPQAREQTWYVQSLYSVWRIGTREVAYGEGTGAGTYLESVEHPLAGVSSLADLDRYEWPNPDDWDVSGLRADCMAWHDYPILLGSYEPFLLYCRLRGMELAFSDLIEQPDLADAILDRIHAIHDR